MFHWTVNHVHLKVLEKNFGDSISPECWAEDRLTDNNSSVSRVDKKVTKEGMRKKLNTEIIWWEMNEKSLNK